MPKDNENIPFFAKEPLLPSEPQGFASHQMVRCEECLRANPPTRLTCLYCAGPLPVTDKIADILRPSLKPIENWALGYNNIFLPPAPELSSNSFDGAAKLLKLDPDDLRRLLSSSIPMPLARTEVRQEAELIERRLKALGFESGIVPDADLDLRGSPPIRLRSLGLDENGFTPERIVQSDESQIPWSRLVLLVTGRLFRKRVELQERKGVRGETRIDDDSQFFADETVVDLYSEGPDAKFRILAGGFDFSGLPGKRLLVAENFSMLLEVFRAKAPQAVYDDTYNTCRRDLEIVWPCNHHTESRGWRRERPGSVTLGAVTESNNEDQFTRYSRLRYFLKAQATF